MGDIFGLRYFCLYGVLEFKDNDEDDWLRLFLKVIFLEVEEGNYFLCFFWVRGDVFFFVVIWVESVLMIVWFLEVNILFCLLLRKLDKVRVYWLLEVFVMVEWVGVMNDVGSGRCDGRER